ncbi:hypothetical protein M6D81_11305 [Paenibacillus sp. J5C_2022]|uniref:hypothetical protein n=1 Tax=Paenibacillus sp. J5C2022 TaxID=2977129 RepID=UPI0021D1A457|nr:hypothetical protein [Paenibacillus sp. J5C2022]MCU6709293.1 hypothetical protein [Paenibacillus sp. J5C2022]
MTKSNGSERNWAADRAVCDAATGGPGVWKADGKTVMYFDYDDGDWYPLFYGELDTKEEARFIAEAHTGWPAALDRISELEAENRQLRLDVYDAETWAAEVDEMVTEILDDHDCSLSTREIIEKYYEEESDDDE